MAPSYNLAVISQNLGARLPLFAIHGFGVDHRILLPLEGMIDGLGWERHYVDLPWTSGARNESAHASNIHTPRDVADVAVAEIRAAVGDAPFAVLGQPFGEMVARHVAH